MTARSRRDIQTDAYQHICRGDWRAAVETMAGLGEYWIAGVEDVAMVDELLKLGAKPDAPDPFGRLPIETTRSRTVASHLVRVGASVTEAAVDTAAHSAHLPQRYTGLLRVLRGDGPPTCDDIVDTIHTFVFCESPESIWTVCFGGMLAKWTLENGQLSLDGWHDKGWDFVDWIGAHPDSDALTVVTSAGPVSFNPSNDTLTPAAMPAAAYFPKDPFGGVPFAGRRPRIGESVDVGGQLVAAINLGVHAGVVAIEIDEAGNARSERALWESNHPDPTPWFHLCHNRTTAQLGLAHHEYYWNVPGSRDHFRTYLSVLSLSGNRYELRFEHELLRSEDRPPLATGALVIEWDAKFVVAAGASLYRTNGSALTTIATTDEAIGAIDRCDDHIICAPMSGGLHATAM